MLIQGFPLAGESFPAITIEEAMKFSPAPCLIHFGTHAPMAVFTHGDKKYYHPTQEIARKHVAAKARKARRAAIAEARRLLKEPELTATTQVRNSQPARFKPLRHLMMPLIPCPGRCALPALETRRMLFATTEGSGATSRNFMLN
jgi:hypothetical protein